MGWMREKVLTNQILIDWIKAIAPCLVVCTIVVGIWRFQVEREREAAARYQNIIRDLGNDSNSVRAGAVITMDTYLRQGGKINKKYREQGIYVLATHLAVEPTPLVRATTKELLVDIGVNDNDNIVVRKLACSNRHLWEQEQQRDPNFSVDSVIAGEVKVSKNLQSIANTMIEILQRRRNKSSNQNTRKTLDMSETYLISSDNSVELKGVKFENVELNGACLAGMNFEKCTMENCNLKKARLDNATLTEAKLTTVILDEAKLGGIRFEGAIFKNVSLVKADLRGANLQGADLVGADLTMAYLENANLRTLLLFQVDPNKFQSDLNRGTISEDLRKEFTNNSIYLSQSTDVSIEEKNRRWLITDEDYKQTYTVRKDERLKICTEPNIVETELFSIDSNDTIKFQSDLDKGTISQDFRQEFKNWIDLSENTAISVEEKGRIWLINDKDNKQAFTVKKEEWLNVCKETKFDFEGIKLASNWEKAIFDYDIWEKLASQKD